MRELLILDEEQERRNKYTGRRDALGSRHLLIRPYQRRIVAWQRELHDAFVGACVGEPENES